MKGPRVIQAAMDQAVRDGVFPGGVLAVRLAGELDDQLRHHGHDDAEADRVDQHGEEDKRQRVFAGATAHLKLPAAP